jgi:Skp1 family, tetramerisation domain
MSSDSDIQFVRLVSSEGHDFFVEKNIVINGSKTIRTMLDKDSGDHVFREAVENTIRFPDISAYILERVLRYLHYKAQYSRSTSRIPEFVIEPESALELLLAAKYLDC